MTATPFFHVGFIVHDLDEAMERFGDIFEVDWTGRTTANARFWEPGREIVDLSLDVTYSRQGPPHIELLQAQGDGLYAESLGEGFHHLGAWEPNARERQQELEEKGLETVGTHYSRDGETIVSYFEPSALHGVMLEIIDESRRETLERWFAGEPYVD